MFPEYVNNAYIVEVRKFYFSLFPYKLCVYV
jgi:hypothetical protein